MNSKYAKAKLDYLDSLFHDFESQKLDDYVKSHIAKYLTVLTSGIYEDIIKKLVNELIQKDTLSNEVKQFIFHQINISLRNPLIKNIKGFLNRFEKEWSKKLFDGLDDKHKEALEAIVNNKNLIAHGDSPTITFSNIQQYYQDSKIIIERLDDIILG
jgi:hypothetical protein